MGDDERYKRCYNYSDKTVVKGDCIGKCVVNRAVTFEFFGDDDFKQRARGISWGKFGSHSGSLELFVEFVIKLKRVVLYNFK